MTIFAGSAPFGHRQGETAAGNLVVTGLVAFMTLEAEAAHMDVTACGVEIERGIEPAVLDWIFAAA